MQYNAMQVGVFQLLESKQMEIDTNTSYIDELLNYWIARIEIEQIRMGYDQIAGYLKGGMHAWEVSGRKYDGIEAVHASSLQTRLKADTDFTLLDVRKDSEFSAGRLHGAKHIFLGELPDRLEEIERDKPVVTFCGSGRRAIIASSILKRHGFEQVGNALGSMEACERIGCEIEEG